jgi:hypothetical protein
MNNHVHKFREFNLWCSQHWVPIANENKDASSTNTNGVGTMGGTTSTFIWSFFDTPTFVPTTKVGHKIAWKSNCTYLKYWWGKLYIPKATIIFIVSTILRYYTFRGIIPSWSTQFAVGYYAFDLVLTWI